MLEVISISFAFIFGLAVRQIGLPPLIGYLAAGFALSAYGPAIGLPQETRPILDHYMRTRQEGEALVRALFDIVLSGKVKIAVDQTYPLAEAAQAHRDLESRKTTGSTVLLP